VTEKASGLALLRDPFPANQISKLPKPTKAQTEAVKSDYKKGSRCTACGAWHHPEVVHLDYVGHAAITDRLLNADPAWTWEPLAMTTEGLPVMDPYGGMWIRLSICGVTRLGYGHAGDKSGGDAIKEVIGDALRNAAMRFGAALELWHKSAPSAAPKMPQAVIADWLSAIEAATDDEMKDITKSACESAEKAKDGDAYMAFHAAYRKRMPKKETT
jgi:hypothetical protein